MKRAGILGLLGLTLGIWANIAQAGPWDHLQFIKVPTSNMVMTDFTRDEQQPPAPTTQSGDIVSFEIFFRDQTGEAECKATIESQGKGFNARFSSTIPIREDEPQYPIFLMHQNAACLSAQRAYLRGQPVTVNGLLDSGPTAANGLPTLKLNSFTQFTESTFGTANTVQQANVCSAIGCQAQAKVTTVYYPLNQHADLCSATLKIVQADQSEQFATARVQLSPEFCRKEFCEGKDLRLMNAHLQACQLFEEAMSADRNVTVLGYGQGSNISNVISVKLDNAPMPPMTPMF